MPLIGSIRPLRIVIEWNEVSGEVKWQMDRAVPFPALVGVFCTLQMQLAQSVLAGVAAGAAGGPVVVPPSAETPGKVGE